MLGRRQTRGLRYLGYNVNDAGALAAGLPQATDGGDSKQPLRALDISAPGPSTGGAATPLPAVMSLAGSTVGGPTG